MDENTTGFSSSILDKPLDIITYNGTLLVGVTKIATNLKEGIHIYFLGERTVIDKIGYTIVKIY